MTKERCGLLKPAYPHSSTWRLASSFCEPYFSSPLPIGSFLAPSVLGEVIAG
jgi:hypothetical protein